MIVNHKIGVDMSTDQILSTTVKKLREVLSSYVTISIKTMTELIPEFVYYIRFAEFIEKQRARGYEFSKAQVCVNAENAAEGAKSMQATGLGLYTILICISWRMILRR